MELVVLQASDCRTVCFREVKAIAREEAVRNDDLIESVSFSAYYACTTFIGDIMTSHLECSSPLR